MSFQHKSFWMSRDGGCITEGEVGYDNSSRIEPKRGHQWFMDASGSELFSNKKQAIEAVDNRPLLGGSQVNVSPWQSSSRSQSVPGQFINRLFGSDVVGTINMSDRNIPSVGGGDMSIGLKDLNDQYGGEFSRGLSMSHTVDDPAGYISYGGLRKVKINEVRDSSNDISASLGHPYSRGDNAAIAVGGTYNKSDGNTISLGPTYGNGVRDSRNDISASWGHSYSRGDNTAISVGSTYNKSDGKTISLGPTHGNGVRDSSNDISVSLGHSYSRVGGTYNKISLGPTYGNGVRDSSNDISASSGHSYSRGENTAVSMVGTYSKSDGNTRSLGPTYGNGFRDSSNDISASLGHSYSRGDNTAMSVGGTYNKSDGNTRSLGPTNGNGVENTIPTFCKADGSFVLMGHTFSKGDGSFMSMGHNHNQGEENILSKTRPFDKADTDFITMGPPYEKGDSNIMSMAPSNGKGHENFTTMGSTYDKENETFMSIGRSCGKGDDNIISIGATCDKGDSSMPSLGSALDNGESSNVPMGQNDNPNDSNTISFGGFHDEPETNPSRALISSYDTLLGDQNSAPTPEVLAQKDLVQSNAEPVVNNASKSNSKTDAAGKNKEQKTSKKAPSNNFPANVKSLLSTGILDGVTVKYVSWSREKTVKGSIKGTGYVCGCKDCNFNKTLNAYEFERHANCKTKHPNNHIYFDNGKTIYAVVQELKNTPQEMLFDAIQTVTGSEVNQKNFRIWKASYQAATRELQRIYGKDEVTVPS